MRRINSRKTTDIVTYGEERLKDSYSPINTTIFTKDDDGDVIVDYDLFLDKYYAQIKADTEIIDISEDATYKKYKYHPRELSYDRYSTEEMWRLILSLNGMTHPAEFTSKYVIVPTVEVIQSLRKIYISEEDFVTANHLEHDM